MSIRKHILVLLFVLLCIDAFWIFEEFWWHYFFLVGYALLGWGWNRKVIA